MLCTCGAYHTIILSDDGVVYCSGDNERRQLGLKDYKIVVLPTPIPNLPKIQQISCGYFFTACVDYEGFLWAFGNNNSGQLGTGNTTEFNVPQKIPKIPPVLSVACGNEHILIITNDSNLWSCGYNEYGQLCLGNTENQSTFQLTSFSNISKISLGSFHSLFQKENEEIYACGYNENGELGLGHSEISQITPSLIPNLPSNIVQFVCGSFQNLFLDSEGNVFSVGQNLFGQLGLGHEANQNVLNQIPNIPPIQSISCIGISSFLLDLDGNVWSFGSNEKGQLGQGDYSARNIPTKIENLHDIEQISYGCCGAHFLAKDSRNTIFATGSNAKGQLGRGNNPSISIPDKVESFYSAIWGNIYKGRGKSARK